MWRMISGESGCSQKKKQPCYNNSDEIQVWLKKNTGWQEDGKKNF